MGESKPGVGDGGVSPPRSGASRSVSPVFDPLVASGSVKRSIRSSPSGNSFLRRSATVPIAPLGGSPISTAFRTVSGSYRSDLSVWAILSANSSGPYSSSALPSDNSRLARPGVISVLADAIASNSLPVGSFIRDVDASSAARTTFPVGVFSTLSFAVIAPTTPAFFINSRRVISRLSPRFFPPPPAIPRVSSKNPPKSNPPRTASRRLVVSTLISGSSLKASRNCRTAGSVGP